MVRPRSLRCRLGCVATGFTMDGMLFLHGYFGGRAAGCNEGRLGLEAQLLEDAIDDVSRAERESTIHQNGTQLFLRHVGLERQERAELRVAVLFYHEAKLIFGEERFHGGIEGKTADAHEVANDAPFLKEIQTFANCQVAAAESE